MSATEEVSVCVSVCVCAAVWRALEVIVQFQGFWWEAYSPNLGKMKVGGMCTRVMQAMCARARARACVCVCVCGVPCDSSLSTRLVLYISVPPLVASLSSHQGI